MNIAAPRAHYNDQSFWAPQHSVHLLGLHLLLVHLLLGSRRDLSRPACHSQLTRSSSHRKAVWGLGVSSPRERPDRVSSPEVCASCLYESCTYAVLQRVQIAADTVRLVPDEWCTQARKSTCRLLRQGQWPGGDVKINTSRGIALHATARRLIAATRGDRQDPAKWSHSLVKSLHLDGVMAESVASEQKLTAGGDKLPGTAGVDAEGLLLSCIGHTVSKYRPFRVQVSGSRRRVVSAAAARCGLACQKAQPRWTIAFDVEARGRSRAPRRCKTRQQDSVSASKKESHSKATKPTAAPRPQPIGGGAGITGLRCIDPSSASMEFGSLNGWPICCGTLLARPEALLHIANRK